MGVEAGNSPLHDEADLRLSLSPASAGRGTIRCQRDDKVSDTNGTSLSVNHYELYVYVENHGLFIKVSSTEQTLI